MALAASMFLTCLPPGRSAARPEQLLDLRPRYRARHQAAAAEDDAGRRLYPQGAGEVGDVLDRRLAPPVAARLDAAQHQVVPRLRTVGGAPDEARLALGVGVDGRQRIEEGVDRHVG